MDVILSTFRLNGLLLSAGDALAAEHGLTSARWQVLGAIDLAQRPLTVPQVARAMGLTRQSVHASVRRLIEEGLVEPLPNADHLRSQLIALTPRGRSKYRTIDEKRMTWEGRLARGIKPSELSTTARVLKELCDRLEADSGTDRPT